MVQTSQVRESDEKFILASKIEGASFTHFHLHHFGGSVESTVEYLRTQGYRIFFVLKTAYVVDDFLREVTA